jgi:hypothetical protein
LFLLRPPSEPPSDKLKIVLKEAFSLTADFEVVYTGNESKSRAIGDRKVYLYYGDSDSDITRCARCESNRCPGDAIAEFEKPTDSREWQAGRTRCHGIRGLAGTVIGIVR